MSIQPLYEFDENWREQIVKIHLETPRGGRVTGPREGAYGEIYSIELDDSARTRIAAKCPRIKRFGSPVKARAGIEQALHELEKTHRIFMVPWINRFFNVQIIHGWPFVLSRYRNGSLEDLIANPLLWSFEDKLATLIQVVRALRAAQERGISAHQDLKPGNIFFDDMSKKGVPKDSKGMHFHVFVGDFGLADAFRDFGKNSGSRPYMAPEQYSSIPFDPEAPALFDVFALGVIAFECLSDGMGLCCGARGRFTPAGFSLGSALPCGVHQSSTGDGFRLSVNKKVRPVRRKCQSGWGPHRWWARNDRIYNADRLSIAACADEASALKLIVENSAANHATRKSTVQGIRASKQNPAA